jgi:hypothetical protein
MGQFESQPYDFWWDIPINFCRRIIVVDGLIQYISTIDDFDLFGIIIIWIPSPIKVIPSNWANEDFSIESLVFEETSQLQRIEAHSFSRSNMRFLTIPSSVLFLDRACFSECRSLSSVTFESGSRLARIEECVFAGTGLVEIIIPASINVVGVL